MTLRNVVINADSVTASAGPSSTNAPDALIIVKGTLAEIRSSAPPADAIGMPSDAQMLLRSSPGVGWLVTSDDNTANRWLYSCAPGNAVNSAFPDISGKRNDWRPTQNNSSAYANAGYISTTAATFGGTILPVESFQWNPARESLLFSFVLLATTPGANTVMASLGAKTGAGNYGIALSLRANGHITLQPYINGSVVGGFPDENASLVASSAGGNVEHHVTVGYDAKRKIMSLWVDGQLSAAGLGLKLIGANAIPDANLGGFFCLGGLASESASTIALKFRAVQVYKFPGKSLPLSVGRVAELLSATPAAPLPESVFQWESRSILLSLVGQSNEAGAGPSGAYNRSTGRSGPLNDPIRPNGGYSSLWPLVASICGDTGTWLEVTNTAVGSTGLADYWVGRCRNWVSNILIANGSYCLYGGKIWKAATGSLATVVTSTANPSVGGDGVTWTDLGTPGDRDVDGQIYASADAGRFDPNGLIAIAATAATTASAPGHDRYAVYCSIGQTDDTFGVTRAQYAAALVSVANYITSRGIPFLLGFTLDGSHHAGNVSTIHPGYLDAVAALARNPLVVPGADWFAEIGLLATGSSNAYPIPALLTDAVHGNQAAQLLMAQSAAPKILAIP